MSGARAAGPAQVYRCFAEDGECLYVGATVNLESRMVSHKQQTHWAWAVHRIETSHHASLRDARDAEADEIKRLRPRWNIQGRGPRTGWTLADYMEVMFAIAARRDNCGDLFTDPRDADTRIERLSAEFIKRFPDAAPSILSDVRGHLGSASPDAVSRYERRRANLREQTARQMEQQRIRQDRIRREDRLDELTDLLHEALA